MHVRRSEGCCSGTADQYLVVRADLQADVVARRIVHLGDVVVLVVTACGIECQHRRDRDIELEPERVAIALTPTAGTRQPPEVVGRHETLIQVDLVLLRCPFADHRHAQRTGRQIEQVTVDHRGYHVDRGIGSIPTDVDQRLERRLVYRRVQILVVEGRDRKTEAERIGGRVVPAGEEIILCGLVNNQRPLAGQVVIRVTVDDVVLPQRAEEIAADADRVVDHGFVVGAILRTTTADLPVREDTLDLCVRTGAGAEELVEAAAGRVGNVGRRQIEVVAESGVELRIHLEVVETAVKLVRLTEFQRSGQVGVELFPAVDDRLLTHPVRAAAVEAVAAQRVGP